MTASTRDKVSVDEQISQSVSSMAENWKLVAGIGTGLALVGLVALAFPIFTSISVSIILGGSLIFTGFVSIALAIWERQWRGALMQGFLAIIYTVVGFVLLINPVFGVTTITFLLMAHLLISGLAEMAGAFYVRSERGWFLFLVSGAVSFLLGVLIAIGFPSNAPWALGVYIGLSLFTTGAALIIYAALVRGHANAEVTTQTPSAGV